MLINELLEPRLENQRTDEFVQALLPAAGAVLRGVGSAAVQGAKAVGSAIKTGAQVAADATKAGAQGVANAVQNGTAAAQAGARQLGNIKDTITSLKGTMQQAGGSVNDPNKLAQALATQAPGQPIDPITMKSLQGMIPTIADAMKNPQTASELKTLLKKGVNADVQQQVQQQQQQQKTQPGTGTVSPTGSSSSSTPPLS
jgi:hypothetical protein